MKKTVLILFSVLFSLFCNGQSCISSTTNGSFEQPTGCGWCIVNATSVPEWHTSASDNKIEIWPSGYQGVPAHQGNQFAELNADQVSTLYIDICTPCPTTVHWSFAHRGRHGTDVMALKAGAPGGSYTQQGVFSDGNGSWGVYSGTYTIPSGQAVTRFLFESVSSAGGDPTVGNFLDAVSFSATAPVSVNSKTICEGQSATLTATGGSTYSWSTGGTTHQINVSPTTTTSYTVTGTTNGCSTSDVGTVTVYNTPNVTVNSSTICAGQTAVLTEGGGGSTFSWSSGQTTNSIAVSPSSTTSYTVTGTTTHQCSASASGTVTVNPSPAITVNSAAICAGSTAVLKASGADSYSWSTGTTDDSILVTPSATTPYTVTGYNLIGCSRAVTATVTVNPMPVIAVNSAIICAGDTASLTVTGADTYLWNRGETTSSIKVSPVTDTSYSVIGTSLGCSDTTVSAVIVHPTPVSAFAAANVCDGTGVLFNYLSTIPNNGVIQTQLWNFGDGNLLNNTESTSHIYSTAGSYIVQLLVVSDYGCSDSISKTVIVNPNPVVKFTADDTAGCTQLCVSFLDSSSVGTGNNAHWSWNFGDGSPVSTSQNPNHCYTNNASPISFSVILTVTSDSGCVSSLSKNNYISVYPNPSAKFSTANVCAGTSVQFNYLSTIPANDTISHKVWNFGDGNSLTNIENTSHLYASAGSYIVKLLAVSGFGCSDSISKTVTVNPNPEVNFTASDTVGCEPLCISFENLSFINSGTIAQSSWSFGDGTPADISQDLFHCYRNGSVYTPVYFTPVLTVTSDSGCSASLSKNNYFTVYPNPIADFKVMPETTTIVDPVISIKDASAGASVWSWNFGDQTTSTQASPLPHTYADTGSYQITLIVSTRYNCADTVHHTITIEPDFTFYIPNAFTPDGDGINDTFTGTGVFIKEFEMAIFDRWGNLIYKTADINKPWDGKANYGNEIAQRDVYVYSVTVTDLKMKKHSYKGMVALLR